jgi:hypothetical protein
MPARASHLPNVFERNVLQKLKGGELPVTHLGSARIIEKLMLKGWIKRGRTGLCRITPIGETALRAELPVDT